MHLYHLIVNSVSSQTWYLAQHRLNFSMVEHELPKNALEISLTAMGSIC